jgi:hypothetical protein
MAVRLSALRTGRLCPPGNTPGTHFCKRLSRPQGHSAIGRIMSTEKSNDTLWNRTSDLPICSTELSSTVNRLKTNYTSKCKRVCNRHINVKKKTAPIYSLCQAGQNVHLQRPFRTTITHITTCGTIQSLRKITFY